MKPQAVSPAIAAQRLGVSTNTVRRWIQRGLLFPMVTPSESKFGRRYKIRVAEIERFIREHAAGREDSPAIKGE